jgi:hypothetical protein
MTHDLFVPLQASSNEDKNTISALISHMFMLPAAVAIKSWIKGKDWGLGVYFCD